MFVCPVLVFWKGFAKVTDISSSARSLQQCLAFFFSRSLRPLRAIQTVLLSASRLSSSKAESTECFFLDIFCRTGCLWSIAFTLSRPMWRFQGFADSAHTTHTSTCAASTGPCRPRCCDLGSHHVTRSGTGRRSVGFGLYCRGAWPREFSWLLHHQAPSLLQHASPGRYQKASSFSIVFGYVFYWLLISFASLLQQIKGTLQLSIAADCEC